MPRRTLTVLALILLFATPVQLQSPTSLTDEFLKLNKGRPRDISYNEYLGLMTKAARGQPFGDYEAPVQLRAAKIGDDRKAELSRMIIELRNLSLRVRELEKSQIKSNE